jgi:hypothetical protein
MPAFLSEPERWVIPAVLVGSLLGTALMLWLERRRPTSYTRNPAYWDAMTAWRSMSTEAQAAHDQAVLNASEAAENAAARTASLYRS